MDKWKRDILRNGIAEDVVADYRELLSVGKHDEEAGQQEKETEKNAVGNLGHGDHQPVVRIQQLAKHGRASASLFLRVYHTSCGLSPAGTDYFFCLLKNQMANSILSN